MGRFVQWNVFEDGLSDAPGTIGLSATFRAQLDELLQTLCNSGAGEPFLGFSKSRNFFTLPPTVPLNSASRLFGHVDVLYCSVYHHIGGEVAIEIEMGNPEKGTSIGNTLRSLFLHSEVDLDTLTYTTPRFTDTMNRAVGSRGSEDVGERSIWHHKQKEWLLNLKERVISPNGVLTWRGEDVERLWKRDSNVLRDLWQCRTQGPAIFGESTADPDGAQALLHFCRVVPSLSAPGDLPGLFEIELDGSGRIVGVQSRTFQSSILFLLQAICHHSCENPKAKDAIRRFLEWPETRILPSTTTALASVLYSRLHDEMIQWSELSSLERRHEKVWKLVSDYRPCIATFVEFCPEWRKLGLPLLYASARHSSGDGAAANWPSDMPQRGKGQATVVFDTRCFDPLPLESFPGIPPVVRSQSERGVGDCKIAPKSSCIVLLRRPRTETSEELLYLVVSVHLDSAPPSNLTKVRIRRQQLRAVLEEVRIAVKTLKGSGRSGVVVIGGDFNAERTEFVHCEGLSQDEIEPQYASIACADDGPQLKLHCEGLDGGTIEEVCPRGQTTCTRAGKAMVIDFAFVGTFGLAADELPKGTPTQIATLADIEAASNPVSGTFSSILTFGSDHLPVSFESEYLP